MGIHDSSLVDKDCWTTPFDRMAKHEQADSCGHTGDSGLAGQTRYVWSDDAAIAQPAINGFRPRAARGSRDASLFFQP